jgi:tetratricopeptide (TPR) repeat protein
MAQGGWDEATVHPKEIGGDLARCYLALAQERLDAFRHISGDRNVVLDLAEYEWAESHLSRCVLTETGDLDRRWLARRPSDLSEHSYANNRLAEIEMARSQSGLARQRLQRAIAYQEQGQDLYQRMGGNLAWAFALNHLGKSHRLCAEIAVAEGQLDSANQHFAHARRALLEAIEVRPDLGYPFGHLFDLFRLVEEKGLAGPLGLCLEEERAALGRRIDGVDTARGREQRLWLQEHYPEVWMPEAARRTSPRISLQTD